MEPPGYFRTSVKPAVRHWTCECILNQPVDFSILQTDALPQNVSSVLESEVLEKMAPIVTVVQMTARNKMCLADTI